jgi:hypothetical protein
VETVYAAASQGNMAPGNLLKWDDKQTAHPTTQSLNEERGTVYPPINVCGNHQIYFMCCDFRHYTNEATVITGSEKGLSMFPVARGSLLLLDLNQKDQSVYK